MKLMLAALALAGLSPALASAQTAPAAPAQTAPAAPAQTAPAAKFNLDTPIEALVADAGAKAVLDANVGGDITTNPAYETFKAMSLNAVAPFAADQLPADKLKKIEAELAAIK